jgi:hypothetical protein
MDKYNFLLKELYKHVKPLGFKKKRDTFYLIKDNIGIINFQKSIYSSNEKILFTCTLGVYSKSLKIFDLRDVNSEPLISESHWRRRIGFLMSHNSDYWWQLSGETKLDQLKEEVIHVVKNLAIPEIFKYLSDESLIEYWMKGHGEGLTEQQRYLYLIGLLKFYNIVGLQSKIEELRRLSKGKAFENNVKEHLSKLGIGDE